MLMKKALLIGLVIGILAAWSVPAMAIDWSGSGFMAVMFAAARNGSYGAADGATNPYSAAGAGYLDETSSYMFMRGRLMIKAAASPDLYGVFYFEMDSSLFGEMDGGRNHMGTWQADQAAVEVKHCYIDFRVPPKLPVWVRVGVMAFDLAPAVLLIADGTGASARLQIDPIKLTVEARYAKVRDEDQFSAAQGIEIYQGIVTMPIGPVTPQVYFMYNNARYANSLAAGSLDHEQLWWMGLNLRGKIGLGSVTLVPNVDLVWSDGRGVIVGGDDVDYGSWLARIDLAALINKLTVGMNAYYCMGRDWDDFAADNRDSTFQRPRTMSNPNPVLDSHVVWHAGSFGGATGGVGGPSLGGIPTTASYGVWWLEAYAWYQLFDWLKVGANFSYIGDTEEDGDAIDRLSGNNGDADDDHSIGWEFDFAAQVALYKNLQWNTAFGYLFAHKGLHLAGGVEPDDPWAFRSSLVYRF
jgi:hypothetical protein